MSACSLRLPNTAGLLLLVVVFLAAPCVRGQIVGGISSGDGEGVIFGGIYNADDENAQEIIKVLLAANANQQEDDRRNRDENIDARAQETLSMVLGAYDTNGDGTLDADELEGADNGQAALEESDANSDGSLSGDELLERYRERARAQLAQSSQSAERSAPAQAAESSSQESQIEERLQQLPPERRRQVQEALQRARERMRELEEEQREAEADNDGAETAGRGVRIYAERFMRYYDSDDNGVIDSEEIESVRRIPVDGLDSNEDGNVDLDELTEAISRQVAGSAQRRGPGGRNDRGSFSQPPQQSSDSRRPPPQAAGQDAAPAQSDDARGRSARGQRSEGPGGRGDRSRDRDSAGVRDRSSSDRRDAGGSNVRPFEMTIILLPESVDSGSVSERIRNGGLDSAVQRLASSGAIIETISTSIVAGKRFSVQNAGAVNVPNSRQESRSGNVIYNYQTVELGTRVEVGLEIEGRESFFEVQVDKSVLDAEAMQGGEEFVPADILMLRVENVFCVAGDEPCFVESSSGDRNWLVVVTSN